ncbi:MAG: hypothetical protein ACM3SW_01835, partial [Actinomycetota bacterium]
GSLYCEVNSNCYPTRGENAARFFSRRHFAMGASFRKTAHQTANEHHSGCPQQGIEQDIQGGNQSSVAGVIGVERDKEDQSGQHTGPDEMSREMKARLDQRCDC